MENISAERRKYIRKERYEGTVLNLSDRQLSKVPEAVTGQKDLEKLQLYRNNLTELPTSINKLKNLLWLDLDENQLTYLPDSIGDLKKLSELSVSNNQLSAVPSCVQQLKKFCECQDLTGRSSQTSLLLISHCARTVLLSLSLFDELSRT